jgi:protoporphyrinogen oxidase
MEKPDHIIIGAGMAGLHTAYRLQQRGRKVLVLEKEDYAGGRMSSHEIDGHFADFGAKFVTDAYRHMLPLARELGVELVPIHLTKAAIRKEGKMYHFDGARKFSNVLSYGGISFAAKLRLGLAALYAMAKHRGLDPYEPESALHLDDKSTYDDFRPLAGAEGFDHVVESFCRNVIFHGTKDLSRAAFYSILFKLLTMKTFTFPRGIGELCEKMAVEVSVERGVEARSVRRTPEGSVVQALKDGRETEYLAGNVILAVPGSRVLDILNDPLPHEKEFFSQVRYAGTVQILCEGKTDLFERANVIWTLPKEESNFTALGSRGWRDSSTGALYFTVALRENIFRRLRAENALEPGRLEELIQEEFPQISDVKVVRVQVWESATPVLYPGYWKILLKFLGKANRGDGIYFCGDYLENPSTEGALTSSVKLLEKLMPASKLRRRPPNGAG